jgi:hypothetical protein
MKRHVKMSLTILLAAGLMVASSYPAMAAKKVRIQKNGAGSTNLVSFSSFSSSVVNQSNNMSVGNVVSVSSNTGGNSINKTTGSSSYIVSGNSSTTISINTNGNVNQATVKTCCTEDLDECPTPTPSPEPTPTPTTTPTPTPEPCNSEVGVWSSSVETVSQGTLKNGNVITDASRTNPDNALGTPDGSFFSIGRGGSIVVKFSQPIINKEGVDLSFHEVTNGRDSYPEEKAKVEVSADNVSWFEIGMVSNIDNGTGESYLDMNSSGLESASYVKITDMTDYDLHNDQADGYDLDAVDGTSLICEV